MAGFLSNFKKLYNMSMLKKGNLVGTDKWGNK
jgi:hypothetical protein